MNKRDERGWLIPRKGTRSYEIYHLMVDGWTNNEIIELMKEDKKTSSVKVIVSNIKNPEVKNKRQLNYLKANPNRKPRAKRQNGSHSYYVKKLVRVLGISYAEAVEIERREIENADKNRVLVPDGSGTST